MMMMRCRLVAIILVAALLLPAVVVRTIDVPPDAGTYTEAFFQQHLQQSKAYPALVRVMSSVVTELFGMEQLQLPNNNNNMSVLDVGCGHGLLVEAWRNVAGVSNSYGVEGSDAAVSMWPTQYKDTYYRLVNLEAESSREQITPTDIVTTFEVAEHIQPEKAAYFVELLTLHTPKLIFFGAATPWQDQGNNPSHVNEQPFQFWIDHFANRGYHVDWASTALAKIKLLSLQDPLEMQAMIQAWWYPKNLLIFARDSDRSRSDKALLQVPDSFSMLDPALVQAAGQGTAFGSLWERDMRDFGWLFHKAQKQARSQDDLLEL